MRKKHLLIFLLFLLSKPLISQDTSFMAKIKIPPVIDTLFIDHDRNNWSIRLFTNYKDNKFKLSNTDHSVLYTPHNPFGFGFGLGTRKVLLDIAFNIKAKDKEPTERFDLQATLMLNNHQLNFTIQRYHGFNVNDGLGDEFRTDITSFSSGLVYMYMFNASEYSMAAIKSGLSKQKKSAVTSGLGGFIFMNRISADSSIIPPELYHLFNEEARIVNLPGIGAGALVNLSATVPFFKNFFANFKFLFNLLGRTLVAIRQFSTGFS